MQPQHQDLTLKNALTDPLVLTVMEADGVDPQELSEMLNEIVSTLDRRAQRQPQSGPSATRNELYLSPLPSCRGASPPSRHACAG